MVKHAQVNNRKHDVTGWLMYDPRSNLCCQYIEGLISDIDQLYSNIQKDDRADPDSFILLKENSVVSRKYTEWSMKLDEIDMEQLEEDWERETSKWRHLYEEDAGEKDEFSEVIDDKLLRAREMLDFINAPFRTIRLDDD